MAETLWVVPVIGRLDALMAQLVLNAGEFTPQEATGSNGGIPRSQQLLALTISQVQAAVRSGRRVPLSNLTNSVPPEAEQFCYILTINLLTAGKPNLGAVILTLNGGVISPFMDLVKRANAWLDAVGKGQEPVPTVPTDPVMVGTGFNLAPEGSPYNALAQLTTSLLQPGRQYSWTPGPNEVSLTNGALTLTAAGIFYAQSSLVTITGNLSGNVCTGSLQRTQVDANIGRSARVRGQYDLTTFGPYGDGCLDGRSPNLGTL